MARDRVMAPVCSGGYMARRSATELAVLDVILVAAIAVALAPRLVHLQPAAWGAALMLLPGVVALTRSLSEALTAPGRRSLRELRPDHVPGSSRALARARVLTRHGLTLSGAASVSLLAVVGTASLVP